MSTNPERVMLLIDADNVSLDIMEQAVRLVHQQHGGLHVRRAYCTAESAVKHQVAFKRMGIKPMVNLAAGKNSTDIALAVDAIDLVLAERPDVVVIASSDSDFAPLVQRLREKGCIVRGIGQAGKTADETQDVYDDYTVLEHRKPSAAETDDAPARKTAARKTPARKASSAAKTAAKATPAKKAAKAPAAKKAAATAKGEPAAKPAAKTARKTAARKSAAGKAATGTAPELDAAAPSAPVPAPEATAPPPAPAPVQAPPAATARPAHPHRGSAGGSATGPRSTAAAVFDCLPELAAGQPLALNVAVQRLREARLLGKNASSSKLFAQLADQVELVPPDKPTQLRRRA